MKYLLLLVLNMAAISNKFAGLGISQLVYKIRILPTAAGKPQITAGRITIKGSIFDA